MKLVSNLKFVHVLKSQKTLSIDWKFQFGMYISIVGRPTILEARYIESIHSYSQNRSHKTETRRLNSDIEYVRKKSTSNRRTTL